MIVCIIPARAWTWFVRLQNASSKTPACPRFPPEVGLVTPPSTLGRTPRSPGGGCSCDIRQALLLAPKCYVSLRRGRVASAWLGPPGCERLPTWSLMVDAEDRSRAVTRASSRLVARMAARQLTLHTDRS
ncbi:hypothetical protein BHE74_00045248 [Ensete ventricosum]|nr:hypothetical protein BHE74_00045248 [Ensete ventricosum]